MTNSGTLAGGTRIVGLVLGLCSWRQSTGRWTRFLGGSGLVILSRVWVRASRSGGCGSSDSRTTPPTWCRRVIGAQGPARVLALLLAIKGVLAWTAVDTAGQSHRGRWDFDLVPGRLTRERPLVQVQYGPHIVPSRGPSAVVRLDAGRCFLE